MSFKRIENKLNVSFFVFKKFVKKGILVINHQRININTKIGLVFSAIVIMFINPQKIKRGQIKQLYGYFLLAVINNHLFCLLQYKKLIKIPKHHISQFYLSLYFFYENSQMLNYFLKKKQKIKNLNFFNDLNLHKFLALNQNLKLILFFVKSISASDFNLIFRKILLLG